MRSLGLIAAALLLLAGCGSRDGGTSAGSQNEGEAAPAAKRQDRLPAPAAPAAGAPGWDLQSSGEGTALVLLAGAERTAIRLFCPAGGKRLLVNVPGFRPIGSEERLSFGSGGNAAALVADTSGDEQRGGVSGTGPVPADLAALVGGPVSVSYGAQTSGPHPAPPSDLARGFVAACRDRRASADSPGSTPAAAASPCLMQGGRRLETAPLRAVGTEPFWGARIEGRCVTYSHPDDQRGTRVWTRFTPGPGGGIWSGTLGGRRFELRTRSAPGCSDGMSDRRYPIAVELTVHGERRTGCAEPV